MIYASLILLGCLLGVVGAAIYMKRAATLRGEVVLRADADQRERALQGPQRARVMLGGRSMLNLCSNNYLGLADDPRLIAAAKTAMDSHGYGMASVRFICGTQDVHKALEARLATRSMAYRSSQ